MDFEASPIIPVAIGVLAVILFLLITAILSRYKKCPSDKVLVIYGKVGKGKSAKCVHGGAAFILPVLQSYDFLSLRPIQIDVPLQNALSKRNIRVDVPCYFTVGISTDPAVMNNAAERLLGLDTKGIMALAQDIIIGQLRLVVATMEIEEINQDRDKFLMEITKNVESEIEKIGLRLINVNIKDISDESGYIISLGKKAAAEAINKAKIEVSQKERDGAIGEALAIQERRVQVANANAMAVKGEKEAEKDERVSIANAGAEAVKGEKLADQDQRIAVANADAKAIEGEKLAEQNQRIAIANADAEATKGEKIAEQNQRIAVAHANAEAVKGENKSKIEIAQSIAEKREKEAEAEKIAVAAEKVQAAKALEEAYAAEQIAEVARATKEKASLEADRIVKAEIQKREVEIAAEAEAEKIRREAKGEADGEYEKMAAQGRGVKAILEGTAQGMESIVGAAGGNPDDAAKLMIVDKIVDLTRIQVDAIKNIKIDKVTVWDGGSNGKEGKTSTADFISGLTKSVPVMNELFNQAGLELPSLLGKKIEESEVMDVVETVKSSVQKPTLSNPVPPTKSDSNGPDKKA